MVSPIEIFLFTKVASTFTLVLCLFLILFFFIKIGAKQKAISLLVSSCTLFTIVITAKEYFQIARPANSLIAVSGYAFPSGHAAGVVFLAIIVSFLSWRLRPYYRYLVLTTCVITAGVVTYSRIVLHVHTWFQVTAGIGIGMMCGFLFIYLCTRR
jgi:membrane-associated phospholipid phosphatase